MQAALEWLGTTPLSQIRLVDVLDILIVSTLLYTLVAFLRRTRAGFVAIGLVILGLLYVVAQTLTMALTAGILGAFFAVFLVIVVVIFQEELRQLFEQIAAWSMRRTGRSVPAARDASDVLVPCLFDLARERVGALVVIPQRQRVDRHVNGGIPLGGTISVPLLKSLFDASSPGHDGAVIVEGDRITRFAVHLPLSRSETRPAALGTRHSAALGLSELTDALCVVVSEERGVVSVAEQGELHVMRDAGALRARVARALQPEGGSADGASSSRTLLHAWTSGLRRNWGQKVTVTALVTALWFVFVSGERPFEADFAIPLEVENLPATFEVEHIDPPQVSVTFSGMRRAFYFFDHGSVIARIDASLAEHGRRTFTVGARNVLFHPPSLTVRRIEPGSIRLALRRAETNPAAGP